MTNALTDPAGAIADGLFAPNTIDGPDTSAFDDDVSTQEEEFDAYLNTANDVQPGLKDGQGFTERPSK